MATAKPKQSQSDPLKNIFLSALESELKKPENAKHQNNIKAMMAQATKSGSPKPKHTWWALDGKVYDVENKNFQQTMAKNAKRKHDIYAMGSVAFQSAHSTPPTGASGSANPGASGSAKPIGPPSAEQMAQTTEYKQKWLGNPLGMHIIYSKIRVGPSSGGDKDDEGIDLDVCNDTGSTLHVVGKSTWDKFLEKSFKGKTRTVPINTPGGSFNADCYDLELRLFGDMQREKPLTDWFRIESIVRPDHQKQLSGSELRDQAIFATPMGNEKLIVGTSRLGVAWKILTS